MLFRSDAAELKDYKARVYLDIGESWQEAKEPVKAEHYLVKAVELAVDKSFELCSLARFYQDQKRFADALSRYEQMLDEDIDHKTYSVIYMDIGLCCLGMGNNSKAIGFFEKHVKLHPDSGLGFYNLGTLFLRAKDFDGAEMCFTMALQVNKLDDQSLHNLSLVYAEKDEYDSA